MEWKKYEKEILTYFQETYPDADILFDQKIPGKYSKVLRQIDILIKGEVAGYTIKIVVDCKSFSKNIDVKQVESFCSMVEDVDAHQGVLITRKGYSHAAVNRAHYGSNKVELDVINLDELKPFQSFEALPYVGHFCVFVPAPFGWVLDLNDRINSFATLHQRGLTLKEAQERNEWMFMNFWKKGNEINSIGELIESQNQEIQGVGSDVMFDYDSLVKRDDGHEVKIRIVNMPSDSFLTVTGFIDFDEYIYFIVLFTPKELLSKNIRKLQYALKVATSARIEFDNERVIEQCLASINPLDDNEVNADKYMQVGNWYKEMDNFIDAFASFEKAIEYFPNHYANAKYIIEEALRQELDDKALKYSISFFENAPKNPRSCQDLIDIYFKYEKSESIVGLFYKLINNNSDAEVLGNLNFHLALFHLNTGNIQESDKHTSKARLLFQGVLPKSHQVFKSLKELEKALK